MHQVIRTVNKQSGTVCREFEKKQEALDCAKRYRKMLTVGEKGYYKLSYITKEIK
jgi:prophage antirepressor-like protein